MPDKTGTTVIYTDLDNTLLGRGGSLFMDAEGNWTGLLVESLATVLAAGAEVVPISGRTIGQMAEISRLLGSTRYIAELGCFLCERAAKLTVMPTFGRADTANGSAYDEIAASGAVSFLLDSYTGRIEYHEPWASVGRECTHLFRGDLDTAEVSERLSENGFGHLALVDNGPVRSLGNLSVAAAQAYHLMPVGVTKGTAVQLDINSRGLDTYDCIAIGDSATDLTMAPYVSRFFLVADPRTSNSALYEKAAELPNVSVTKSPGPLGWAEVAADLPLRPRT